MKKYAIKIIFASLVLFSCKQSDKSNSGKVNFETWHATESIESKKLTASKNKFINTRYEYAGTKGKKIIIENSLPKGGLNYTDSNGKKFVYAVFWTRIVNQTINPIELTIDFQVDSFEIPSSSGNYMRLFIPPDKMTADKMHLHDYGLTTKSFLDNSHKSSSLKKKIHPNGSNYFYVVARSNRWVGGPLRTGFSLKGQNLFYRINDKEIICGKIIVKKAQFSK